MAPSTVRAAVTTAAPWSLGKVPSATMAMMKTNVSPRPTMRMAPAVDTMFMVVVAVSTTVDRDRAAVSFVGIALQRAKHRALTRSRVRQLLYDLLQRRARAFARTPVSDAPLGSPPATALAAAGPASDAVRVGRARRLGVRFVTGTPVVVVRRLGVRAEGQGEDAVEA